MKLFNIILIIFAVCVCTGILIIISRLDLIKEQIVAIAAILTSLVSKPNNSVKYGGNPIERKDNIIVDGVNISIAIQNFMSSMIQYGTGKYVNGNELYKMTLFTLLKYTSGTIHFVFKTEFSDTLYDFCQKLIIRCNHRENQEDTSYQFIKANLHRLNFYNATYTSVDSEPEGEKKSKKEAIARIEILARNMHRLTIPDKTELHMLKELDDNYIMILAQSYPNTKIVSRDNFSEMQSDTDHFPSNYNVNIISYLDNQIRENTIHINVNETKGSVKEQAKSITPRLVKPIFEIKDGNVYISDNPADDMKLLEKQKADQVRIIQLSQARYDKYKRMLKADGKLLNGHGYLIDENKNIVDKNGYIIYVLDHYKRLVDNEGQLVNGDGYLQDEKGNLIDGLARRVDTENYYYDDLYQSPIYELLHSTLNPSAGVFTPQVSAQPSIPSSRFNANAMVFTPASSVKDINQNLQDAEIYPSTK